MASTWAYLVRRDDSASSSNTLGTGAIAGIAVGAGVLLLSAAGLFILYWRRQKQLDRAEAAFYSNQSMAEDTMFPTGMPKAYTMDYKLDQEDGGSSHVYTPEDKVSPADLLATAMPTHPAYIPRALVRGTTPRVSPSRSQFSASSPPSAPTSAGNSAGGPYQSYRSRDSVHDSITQSPPYHQSQYQQYASPPQSTSSTQRLRSPASKLSPLILPTSARSKYSSPRVVSDETASVITAPTMTHHTAASPPLPRNYQPQQVYDEYAGSGTEQQQRPQRSAGLSFRERSNSTTAGATLDRSMSRAGDRRKEHYEEVEVGQDAEIW